MDEEEETGRGATGMGIGTKRRTRTRMRTRTTSPAHPASSSPASPPALSQGAEEEEEEEEGNKEEEDDEKETGTPGAQALVVPTAPTRASHLAAALRLLHCGWAARVREALRSETRSRTRTGNPRKCRSPIKIRDDGE